MSAFPSSSSNFYGGSAYNPMYNEPEPSPPTYLQPMNPYSGGYTNQNPSMPSPMASTCTMPTADYSHTAYSHSPNANSAWAGTQDRAPKDQRQATKNSVPGCCIIM